MQGRPDPALPQIFVEQQSGGSGVSSGQEGGKWPGHGAAVAGKDAGCACASARLVVLAAMAIQPLATAVGERHANLRPKDSSIY